MTDGNVASGREAKRAHRRRPGWLASALLLSSLFLTGTALAAWKLDTLGDQAAAAAGQAEPVEWISAAVATPHEHRPTVTSIGTVLATRSVTLRNELAGTVREVRLVPGRVVEAGSLLVRLDVSVEEAELAALQAQARLAQTLLDRNEQASRKRAVSEIEVDRARAERDVTLAQIARVQAVIDRKTIRAPFRARVGLADVHTGQYLDEGTVLTTLQGIDDVVHVDFAVAQDVAAGLRAGGALRVHVAGRPESLPATIVAVDSRVDPETRNALVRARIDAADGEPAPGASVRVEVPNGEPRPSVAVPVKALRKGPAGDHVFVIEPDGNGDPRVHLRSVRSGTVLADEVLILSGLDPGERVAASGSFKLRDAALVALEGEGPAAAGGGR